LLAITVLAGGSLASTHAAAKELLVGTEELSFGSLEVDLPEGWVVQYNDPDSPSGPAYSFMAAGGKEFKLLVTPLPALKEGSPQERCAAARALAEQGVEFFKDISEEQQIPVHERLGDGNCMYFISVADKTVDEPTMENFKYATCGGFATGHIFASFTILHNVKNEPEIAAAFDMLRKARHAGGPSDPSATAAAAMRLRYPGRRWSLVVDASGMELDPVVSNDSGTGWRFGGHADEKDLMMSIFFEIATSSDDPKVYRKRYRKKVFKDASVKREKVRQTEHKGMALLWYTNVIEGVLRQPNVNAFLVRDSVWVDVHLSSTQDIDAAERMFNEFINAIRIEE
jgi:hypothetical protein